MLGVIQLFAQNLSLFSKLFIETKSVCFDVTTFLYYLLIDHGPSHIDHDVAAEGLPSIEPHSQIVGFFSKEKLSWDNNNLACILVFPPWQKRGLGQLLMGASYELSRREGRLGGPERREYLYMSIMDNHSTKQMQHSTLGSGRT